jgi:hypothetical protein
MTNNGQHREVQPPKKKPYGKPALLQISLRPEEAVLGNCKAVSTGAGPGGTSCHSFGNCSTQGS